MQPIYVVRVYYGDKKQRKRLHIMKADIITIKNIDLISQAQLISFFLQGVF